MRQISILILTLAFLLSTSLAMALTSGSCAPLNSKGESIGNCTWTLEDNLLKFSGQGPMQDYEAYQAPWYDQRKLITSVDIAEGITSIGKYSLFQTYATEVYIPASVEKINLGSISQMSKLENVVFTEGSHLKEIGSGALMDNPKLTSLVLPDGINTLGPNFLAQSKVEKLVLPDSLFIKQNGIGKYSLTGVSKIYCSKENENKCESYFETAISCDHVGSTCHERPLNEVAVLEIYEKIGSEYYIDGKFYLSPSDIGTSNNIKKRIYTVEEAAKVSKPAGNIFKIRYK